MQSQSKKFSASLALLVGACCAATTPVSGGGLDDSLSTLTLVRAKVISVKPEGAKRIGQLEINHVYCGPAQLSGRTFAAASGTGLEDSTGFTIAPALETGEAGIWALRERGDALLPVSIPQLGVIWPAREKVSARYAQDKALAEIVERFAQTAADHRPALLKSLALDDTPEISAWAIHALADAGRADGAAFLNQLASNPKLGLAGQVALDEVLADADATAWNNSTTRQALVKDWLLGARGEFETGVALNRLDALYQHRGLDGPTLLTALNGGISNTDLPLAARRNALRIVGLMARGGPANTAAFDALVERVRTSDEPAIRLAAAYAIKNIGTLDAARADSVRAARGQLSDQQTADVLSSALGLGQKN
jgi:hypothetical protein